MFGKNPVASPMADRDNLIVNDLFYTLQGEGPDAGRPAIFLRLSHCNLRCWFCDTEFESGTKMPIKEVRRAVEDLVDKHRCKLLVITGGEPLLQNVMPLTVGMERPFQPYVEQMSIETAGTIYYPELRERFVPTINARNKIICSPKTPKIQERLAYITAAFKYIIKCGEVDPEDGLPVTSTQLQGEKARLYRPEYVRPIYVQPCDEQDAEKNEANLQEATRVALQYGYRLSIQMHKLAGVP